jgi:hypothetical protein
MAQSNRGGRARLASITLEKNHGVTVVYRHRHLGASRRFVPAAGAVTLLEASRLLKCHTMRLYRLAAAGRIRLRQREGKPALVSLGDVRRILRSQ